MDHTRAHRVMTALVAAGVLIVSACGSAEDGSSSSPSTAAAAPSTSLSTGAGSATGAPTSGATAGSTTASSVDQPSAASSDPTSAEDPSSTDSPDSATSPTSTESSGPDGSSEATATSQTTESSSPTSGGEGVSVTDAAGLTVLARQLGCTAPKVQAAKPGSEGAKAGATAVASCTLDGTQYLLAATKNTAGVPALIKSFSSSIAGGQKVFYVVGPTWFALGSKTGEDAPEDVARAIQAKIGGEVSSTD